MSPNKIIEVHAECSGNKFLYSSVHDWVHSSSTTAVVINYVLTGTEHYQLNSRTRNVGPKQYLVMNKAQPFDVSIDHSRSAVTGFAIYLCESVLADVARNLHLAEATLLENPLNGGETTFEFFDGVYADDTLQSYLQNLTGKIGSVKNSCTTLDRELYFDVARELLLAQGAISKTLLNLKPKSIAVKKELYKRMQVAKYRLDESAETIKIPDLAAAVALSEFHFYRTFRQAFGISPHRYQTKKKVEKAIVLLQQEGLPVSEIAYTLGFSDVQSFSKTFKQHCHVSPVRFRQKYSRI